MNEQLFKRKRSTVNVTATVIEINSDGSPDLVRKEENKFGYHLNTGKGFVKKEKDFFEHSIGTDFSLAGNIFE